MRSLPRVLKAASVYIDQDNMVQIKADIPLGIKLAEAKGGPLPDDSPFGVELSEASDVADSTPEEIAQDIVQRAQDQAKDMIEQAKKEASTTISKAQAEAEALVLEATARMEEEGARIREESRNEGHQQGMDQAAAEGNAIRAEAQKVLDDAVRERDEMRLALEPDAVNLIINIVEKLLGDIVRINPAVIVSLIRMGFGGATMSSQSGQAGNRVMIRVSEADYLEAVGHMEEIKAAAGGVVEIEIVKDTSLSQADCIIDTPYGGIDVSLGPQFEALKENLIFLLEHPV